MAEREDVVLTRDVNIVTIPDGNTGTLSQGQIVTIHQALGDNYTVVTEHGHMVRIAGVDADALGKEPNQLHTLVSETDAAAVEQNCWEVMKTVYDPEIPVNIVDLGLVYQCLVTPTDDGLNHVHVIMTLTAPAAEWALLSRATWKNASAHCPASPALMSKWCLTRPGRGK
jgi:Domain of unknown function DUF59.